MAPVETNDNIPTMRRIPSKPCPGSKIRSGGRGRGLGIGGGRGPIGRPTGGGRRGTGRGVRRYARRRY